MSSIIHEVLGILRWIFVEQMWQIEWWQVIELTTYRTNRWFSSIKNRFHRRITLKLTVLLTFVVLGNGKWTIWNTRASTEMHKHLTVCNFSIKFCQFVKFLYANWKAFQLGKILFEIHKSLWRFFFLEFHWMHFVCYMRAE